MNDFVPDPDTLWCPATNRVGGHATTPVSGHRLCAYGLDQLRALTPSLFLFFTVFAFLVERRHGSVSGKTT